MKIALYKLMFGGGSINHVAEYYDGKKDASDCIRVSEIIDVEFPPLQDSVVIAAQLAACDEKEREIRVKYQQALNMLNDERQRIQALPNLVQP